MRQLLWLIVLFFADGPQNNFGELDDKVFKAKVLLFTKRKALHQRLVLILARLEDISLRHGFSRCLSSQETRCQRARLRVRFL